VRQEIVIEKQSPPPITNWEYLNDSERAIYALFECIPEEIDSTNIQSVNKIMETLRN
jgi:hypothetical protein